MANPEIVAILKLQSTQFVGELRKVRGDFRNLGNEARTLSRALLGIFATGAIARYAKSVIDLGDQLSKLSQRTDLSVEFLNGLVQVAELSGVTTEQLSVSIRTLNKNLLDASNGTGEAKEQLVRFGISAAESGRLLQQPEEALLKIVDVLADIPTASERGAVANKLMGRSGSELLTVFNQGSAALRAQIAELQRHRAVTTADAKASEDFNDALTSLDTAIQGLTLRGVGPLLPALTELVNLVSALIGRSDDLSDRIAGFQELGLNFGTFLRGLASEFIILDTVAKAFTADLAFLQELITNPSNFAAILEAFREASRELDEEFIQRQSKLFPEATGGSRKDFSPKPTPKRKPPPPGSREAPILLDETVVSARSRSAELDALIAQRQARIALIQTEERRAEIETDRVHILEEEIALLTEQLTIQKELEDAVKGKREADPSVAATAAIQKQADLNAIQNERIARAQELTTLEQTGLANDAISTATQRQRLTLVESETALARARFQLELDALDPLRDAALLRGQQIVTLREEITVLQEREEVLGESHTQELQFLQAQADALVTQGQAITQTALGEAIVANATADIEAKLEPFRRAVRDAQREVQQGEILPNQLPDTNRLRRIALIEKELALLDELQRVGAVSTEEFSREFILQDARLRAENDTTQLGFLEGWQQAFQQFAKDQKGVYGLGQTLARNFVANVQQGIGATVSNVFTQLEQGTLSWRTALQTIPDILQQITAQLISMAIVQGLTQAIGGGLGGLFNSTPKPATGGGQLFKLATGGSFMVGGPSGPDRTPVNFLATRGERVTVETAEQQRRRAAPLSITIINNAGAEVSATQRDGIDRALLDIVIEKKVTESIQRGTVGRTIANQFGLPRAGRRN